MNAVNRHSVALLCAAALALPVSAAGHHEPVFDRINDAEDRVEQLLGDHYPVITVQHQKPEAPVVGPAVRQHPATTLISLETSDVQELSAAIDAIGELVPAEAESGSQPGGLRAHVEKAQEIMREMMPSQQETGAVGTSGSLAGAEPRTADATPARMTIDRTALERLEIEIDAMERVAPRH
jgi:hypothetical protein